MIADPPAVLPVLGAGTVISTVISTNANGSPVPVPVTFLTPLQPPVTVGQPPAVPPPAPLPIQLTTSISSAVVTDSTGGVSTVDIPVIKPITPDPVSPTAEFASQPTALPTVVPINGDGGGGGGGGGGGDSGSGLQLPSKVAIFSISTSKTFVGGYMPIVAARFYLAGMASMHSYITTFEPFSQLASPGGAPASVLLGASFSSTWYSWVGYGAAWLLTPFAAETIFFDTNYGCPNPNPDSPENPCWPPRMSINTWVIRLIQGLLGLVAAMSLVASYKWSKKPSGCSAEPTSIASVASVMGHPQVGRDFQSLNPETTSKELKQYLKGKHYKLDHYITPNGTERYGLVPVSEHEQGQEDLMRSHDDEETRDTETSSSNNSRFGFVRMWQNISTYIDGIFILFLVGVLAICASYVKDVNTSRLAKLFESSSVGRRLIFSLIGSVASSNWSRLQRGN